MTRGWASLAAGRVMAVALIATGLCLLAAALDDGVARASLGSLSFSLDTAPPGGVVGFGAIDPGDPVVLLSALTLHVSSDLEWRLLASASPLSGSFVLEQGPRGAGTWVAIGGVPTTLRDNQVPCGLPTPADFAEDARLTAGWDLDPGVYTIIVAYEAQFTDQTPPVPVSLAINGGATYANAGTWSPATLNIEATDDSGIVDAMCFTNDDPSGPPPGWSAWQDYAATAAWNLPGPDGANTVWAKFRDRAGNESAVISDDITLDRTFPTISGVAAGNLTASTVDVTWQTADEASTSQLEYGLDSSYGQSTAVSPDLVTSHLVTVPGLAGGTNYHFRVRSSDPAGNTSLSSDHAFWTRCAAPALSATMTQQGGSGKFTIVLDWTASTGATSYRVERKASADPPESFTEVAAPVITTHSERQSGPFSFDYRVVAINALAGTESDPSNVVTAAAGPHTTPPVIDAVTASPGQASCVVTWITDEPATSAVSYRSGADPYVSTPTDSSLATEHAVTVTGLTADTVYDFYVVSTDEAGNTSQSTPQSFTTPPPSAPYPPAGLSAARRGSSKHVDLRWSQSYGATGYHLYWHAGPSAAGPWGAWQVIDIPGGGQTSYTHDQADKTAYHEYYLAAYNDLGESDPSSSVIVPPA